MTAEHDKGTILEDAKHLYPDWQSEYEAAMFEFDVTRLRDRILSARAAIAERMKALAQDRSCNPRERQAMTDALNGLAVLTRELASRVAQAQT